MGPAGQSIQAQGAVGRGGSEELWSGQGAGELPMIAYGASDCLSVCLSIQWSISRLPPGSLDREIRASPLDLNFRGTRSSPAVSASPD